uniref:Secreted protein n=1 Tax=Elaeophora elaphi TaxID=1147741 RepID=A0A0R3RNV2_9BILA
MATLLCCKMSLAHWTSSAYPDLRGPTASKCAVVLSPGEEYYLCDPDHILNASEALNFLAQLLNRQLHNLTIGTPCHCQRRSQCATSEDVKSPFRGFVASIALVNNLQMTIHSPSEQFIF